MAKRSRALVLSPEAPYPIHGGGQLRTASILEYLRQRYDLEIVTFREPGAPHPHFPEDMRAHVIELPFHSKTTAARVARNVRRAVRGIPPLIDRFSGFGEALRRHLEGRYELCIVEHFWCANYWRDLRPYCDRLIIDLVDIESVLLSRQARGATTPLFQRFAAVCRAMERDLLPRFDGVMVTSAADACHIEVPAVVYPNTIPLVPLPRVDKESCIAFSGNMEYEPNSTGIRWFYRNVWPHLRERVGWKLIGRNDHAIRGFVNGDERITVTGPVDDAVRELATCQVAVVPVLAGSGTRVKIIEAWAAGLPVVSTSVGAEGLPTDTVTIANDCETFVKAVESFLDSPDLRCRLGAAGRRLYEERFTWMSAWSTLKAWGL